MAAKRTPITLVGPDGREYTTTDRSEVTTLRARGYRTKPEPKQTPTTPATPPRTTTSK